MITLINKVIEISPFEVLPKHRTKYRAENVDYFLATRSGIDVSIELNIKDIQNGAIFIDQVCKSHRLFFKKMTGEEFTYLLPEAHYDSLKRS